jgi:hypothetical protein
MMHPEDFICPLCGLSLASWHAFRNHVAKNHQAPNQPVQLSPSGTASD